MDEVGLRDIRQHASEFVRRAQAGERLTITVSGRPAAQLGPIEAPTWRMWGEVADVVTGPADPDWNSDRKLLDSVLRDPWTR
jgi:prevent-host-death family protein